MGGTAPQFGVGVLPPVALDAAGVDHGDGGGPLVRQVFPDSRVPPVVAHLETHRSGHAGVVDGIRHLRHLVQKQRLRLLDEHGNAAPGRAYYLTAVLVRRHGEPDDVDLCLLDEFISFGVACDSGLQESWSEAAHLFELQVLGERVCQRSYPDDFFALQLRQRLDVLQPALPHADYSDFQWSCHMRYATFDNGHVRWAASLYGSITMHAIAFA